MTIIYLFLGHGVYARRTREDLWCGQAVGHVNQKDVNQSSVVVVLCVVLEMLLLFQKLRLTVPIPVAREWGLMDTLLLLCCSVYHHYHYPWQSYAVHGTYGTGHEDGERYCLNDVEEEPRMDIKVREIIMIKNKGRGKCILL